jgi:hypothetical protein
MRSAVNLDEVVGEVAESHGVVVVLASILRNRANRS